MRTIGMSDYTVGEDCFDELPGALDEYGAAKVAIIGGKRALAAALPSIEAALEGTDIEILETRVYGTNSTRANIAKVVNSAACQEADVLIACGGGKALDTVKTAAIELKKIVFTVPTICSNCSAATAIAVVYNDDGSLEGYSYPNRPAHIFINPKIIAEAPAEYFWAGVGDALSKQPEVEYATSAGNLEHTAGLGLALAHTCSEPLFTYGVQGLEDVRQNLSSEAVKQIAPRYRGQHGLCLQPDQPKRLLLQLERGACVLQRHLQHSARGHLPAWRGREPGRARAVCLYGRYREP